MVINYCFILLYLYGKLMFRNYFDFFIPIYNRPMLIILYEQFYLFSDPYWKTNKIYV